MIRCPHDHRVDTPLPEQELEPGVAVQGHLRPPVSNVPITDGGRGLVSDRRRSFGQRCLGCFGEFGELPGSMCVRYETCIQKADKLITSMIDDDPLVGSFRPITSSALGSGRQHHLGTVESECVNRRVRMPDTSVVRSTSAFDTNEWLGDLRTQRLSPSGAPACGHANEKALLTGLFHRAGFSVRLVGAPSRRRVDAPLAPHGAGQRADCVIGVLRLDALAVETLVRLCAGGDRPP